MIETIVCRWYRCSKLTPSEWRMVSADSLTNKYILACPSIHARAEVTLQDLEEEWELIPRSAPTPDERVDEIRGAT
jgi:hypothetical protein